MPTVSILFLILAFFGQLKAIELRGAPPPTGTFSSIAAVICLVVALVTWLAV